MVPQLVVQYTGVDVETPGRVISAIAPVTGPPKSVFAKVPPVMS